VVRGWGQACYSYWRDVGWWQSGAAWVSRMVFRRMGWGLFHIRLAFMDGIGKSRHGKKAQRRLVS
jgi:hypothetical protein